MSSIYTFLVHSCLDADHLYRHDTKCNKGAVIIYREGGAGGMSATFKRGNIDPP